MLTLTLALGEIALVITIVGFLLRLENRLTKVETKLDMVYKNYCKGD